MRIARIVIYDIHEINPYGEMSDADGHVIFGNGTQTPAYHKDKIPPGYLSSMIPVPGYTGYYYFEEETNGREAG